MEVERTGMAYRTFAKQKPAKQLAWLTGETVLFQRSYTSKASAIHRNLLLARCPSANFKTTLRFSSNFWYTHLEDDDETSFSHFLLWIYCDKVAPFTEDWESEYVSAFKFAQKYHLEEFEAFLEDKFAASAKAYYGFGDNNGDVHNPMISTLITAVTILCEDSKISEFLIEQFVRSWIWRRAYSDEEFDDLVDKHPNVAKLLFRRTQDVVKMDADNAVATFGLCGFKSPVHDDVRAEDEAVVVPEKQPTETTEPVPDVSPVMEEPEASAEPTVEDGPNGQAVEDGPLLHKKPTDTPPAGYQYRMMRKKGKKRWRLVWNGERNRDEPGIQEPIAEEPALEEAPIEDAAARAGPELEIYEAVEAEPEPATETVDAYTEPGIEVPESAESRDEASPPPPVSEPRSYDSDEGGGPDESPVEVSWGGGSWETTRATRAY